MMSGIGGMAAGKASLSAIKAREKLLAYGGDETREQSPFDRVAEVADRIASVAGLAIDVENRLFGSLPAWASEEKVGPAGGVFGSLHANAGRIDDSLSEIQRVLNRILESLG